MASLAVDDGENKNGETESSDMASLAVDEGENKNAETDKGETKNSIAVRACLDCYDKWKYNTDANKLFKQLDKEQWHKNENQMVCELCSVEFGVFFWYHHCRYCGKCICRKCSTFSLKRKITDSRLGAAKGGAIIGTIGALGGATFAAYFGVKELTKKAPIIGQVFGVVGKLMSALEQIKRNDIYCNTLHERCFAWCKILKSISESDLSKEAISPVLESFDRLLTCVEEYCAKSDILRAKDYEGFKHNIDSIQQQLDLDLSLLNTNQLQAIDKKVDVVDKKLDSMLLLSQQNNNDHNSQLASISLQQKLNPQTFTGRIDNAIKQFHDGSRKWVFEKMKRWNNNDDENHNSRMFILSGVGGIGKTTIASVLTKPDNSANINVVAHFFCNHKHENKKNPYNVLTTISFQLAERSIPYKEKISNKEINESMKLDDVFDILFAPLHDIDPPVETTQEGERKWVILIDGLDECGPTDLKNDLLNCIQDHFESLPSWLSFIITTRPEVCSVDCLSQFNPTSLTAESKENIADIQRYLHEILTEKGLSGDDLTNGVEILVNKSENLFIYIHYIMKRLARSKSVSLNELKEFPKGIERFYELQFNRLFECKKFDKKFKTTSMWKIIEVIIAANEPLHIDMLINFIEFQDGMDECIEITNKLSEFFPIYNDYIHCIRLFRLL